MKHIFYALLAFLGVFAVAGAETQPPPSLAATAAATPDQGPRLVATVHIKDFAYKAPALKIRAGDTVLFVNDDGDAHTVTADDKSFDSGGMDTSDTWKHTFVKAGSFTYFCALHPYMKAVIVVAARAPLAKKAGKKK